MKKTTKKAAAKANLQKHIMIGAGLGLYFGMFFRPAREPSFLIVIGLTLFVTLVMFLVRAIPKSRPPMNELFRDIPINLLQYFIILAALEGRHFAYDLGGRVGSSILSVGMGAVTGALIYWKSFGKRS